MKLILGSSSKYRKEILEKAGYVFDVLNPEVKEKEIKIRDPYKRPLVLARVKADALVAKVKEPAIIIACDIVVVCEGELYEKPNSEKQAREFLKKYSDGGVPETVCALVVANTKTGKRYEGIDIAKTFFNPFPQAMIEEFIEKGEPFSRAGGFAIQHPIMRPYIKKIEGTEDSIVGMPIHLLKKLLKEARYSK